MLVTLRENGEVEQQNDEAGQNSVGRRIPVKASLLAIRRGLWAADKSRHVSGLSGPAHKRRKYSPGRVGFRLTHPLQLCHGRGCLAERGPIFRSEDLGGFGAYRNCDLDGWSDDRMKRHCFYTVRALTITLRLLGPPALADVPGVASVKRAAILFPLHLTRSQ